MSKRGIVDKDTLRIIREKTSDKTVIRNIINKIKSIEPEFYNWCKMSTESDVNELKSYGLNIEQYGLSRIIGGAIMRAKLEGFLAEYETMDKVLSGELWGLSDIGSTSIIDERTPYEKHTSKDAKKDSDNAKNIRDKYLNNKTGKNNNNDDDSPPALKIEI